MLLFLLGLCCLIWLVYGAGSFGCVFWVYGVVIFGGFVVRCGFVLVVCSLVVYCLVWFLVGWRRYFGFGDFWIWVVMVVRLTVWLFGVGR